MRRACLAALAALALFGLAGVAGAQSWPSRPLRWIVPIPPGGGPDIIARRLAPALAERLGQPVIVENHPGGAHNIAMQLVAHSEPDGHTLLHAVTSLVTNPHLYRLAFDPLRDLVPVARIASTEWVLVARAALPVRGPEDLVAYARSNRTTCAITGGVTEIACRMLAALSGANFVPVAYRGGPQVFNDMLGGHVDLRFAEASIAAPLVKGGRIRALATLNPRRGAGAFGELPTLSETYPGFEFVTWQGIVLRAGTPRDIVARLSAELDAVLADPEVQQAVRATGNQPAYAPPPVFDDIIRKDLARYGALIRKLEMRAEQ
jgi:tripartite-type tricarboxylate transporter receptor subunit TctC